MKTIKLNIEELENLIEYIEFLELESGGRDPKYTNLLKNKRSNI